MAGLLDLSSSERGLAWLITVVLGFVLVMMNKLPAEWWAALAGGTHIAYTAAKTLRPTQAPAPGAPDPDAPTKDAPKDVKEK